MATIEEVLERDTSAVWLGGLVALLRRRWWLVAGSIGLALVAALVWLREAEYRYVAELQLVAAPTAGRDPGQAGPLSGLAVLAGIGGGEAATPYRLYLEGLQSREVARRLATDEALMHSVFAEEWDDSARQWRDPVSPLERLGNSILAGLAGRTEGWHQPDAARLHAWLQRNVGLQQEPRKSVGNMSVLHRDPAFAARLLPLLDRTINEWLRERALSRTRSNIAYLQSRLPTIAVAEHRQALLATLDDQQTQLMQLGNPAAYAADRFGMAVVSPNPVSPKPIVVVIAALVIGTMAGVLLVLVSGLVRA